MQRNSEIPAILTCVADDVPKITPKLIPLVFVTPFLQVLKNLQKISTKTVTPQDNSGFHIIERITEIYWPKLCRPGHIYYSLIILKVKSPGFLTAIPSQIVSCESSILSSFCLNDLYIELAFSD